MSKFEKILKAKNVKIEDLPQNVQKRINRYQKLRNDYESIEDEDKKADVKDTLIEWDDFIIDGIAAYLADKSQEEDPEKKIDDTPVPPRRKRVGLF